MNRKLLTSLLVIGAVGVIAAGSTFALFNDTETSDTNTFEAGALDLQIDWIETYNGEVVEEQSFTDNPGSIFDISDVKPGDRGQANISLHVFNNPAFVNMTMEQTGAAENGCTEPEAEVDSSCGNSSGELGENLIFEIRDNNDELVFNGTAEELDSQSINLGLVQNSTTEYVTVDWHVPRETGNIIQTDSKHFRFDFSAVQARHNGLEDGVPTDEPDVTPGDNVTPPDVTPPIDNDTDDGIIDNDTNVTPPITPPNGDDGIDNDTNVTEASINFEDQTSDGNSVTVDETNLPEGGFVAIIDEEGEVRGASGYLEPGQTDDLTVDLDPALNESQTMTAQAHEDTHDNEQLDFLTSNGTEDTPYTVDGEAVADDALVTLQDDTNITEASINFEDQTSDGDSVVVEEANLPEGGFVAIIDEAGEVIGASEYLESGATNDLSVNLDPALNESQTLTAQAHEDTNDNEQLDFLTSNGTEDTPYTEDAEAVADDALITLEDDNVTDAADFFAELNGSNEVPPVDTNATGEATFDVEEGQVDYMLTAEDIENVTQGHIHLGEPDENGPVVAFLANYTAELNGSGGTPEDGPINVTGSIEADDLVGPLENATLADLQEAMENGSSYVNVHTTQNPDGEIRGQIMEGELPANGNGDMDNDTDDNQTLQGINTVWFCDEGTEDDSPCPSGERSVATVEWNGTNFEPTQIANDTNVEINLTARLQEGNLLEVRWFSGNDLSSVVSRSNGDTCTSPGGTAGVAIVCSPPDTIEIDERRPTLMIMDDQVETQEEIGNTTY